VTLDRLYIDATSFKNLPPPPGGPKRIFFVLTYVDPNIITLSGFPTTPSGPGSGPGAFDPNPAIMLKKAAGPPIIIPGNPVYVGNLVLDPDEVNEIKRNIAQTGAAYVLFDPMPSSQYPNHVQYVTGYTKVDPGVNANPALIPPLAGTVTLNPSPPKSL